MSVRAFTHAMCTGVCIVHAYYATVQRVTLVSVKLGKWLSIGIGEV